MRGLSRYFLALSVVTAVYVVSEPIRHTKNLRQSKKTISKESRDKGHKEHIIPVFIDNSQSDIVEAETENYQEMTPSVEKLPEGSKSKMTTVEPISGDRNQDKTIESSDERREKSHEPRNFGHQTLIKPVTSDAECPKGYLLLEDHQCHKEVDPQLDFITDTTKTMTADDKENYSETGPTSGHQLKQSDPTTIVKPAGDQDPNENKNGTIGMRSEFNKKSQDSAINELLESPVIQQIYVNDPCPVGYIGPIKNKCYREDSR